MFGLMLVISIVLFIGMAAKFTDLRTYLATVLARAADKISIKLNRGEAHDVEFEEPKLVIIAGQLKSDGTVTGPASHGQVAVTEASAASINTYTSGLYSAQINGNAVPTFGNVSAELSQTRRRIFSVDLTSDGAGAIAATAIVPALAGYTGHAQIIGIHSDATDAATTWTFAVTGGTLLGPASHVLAHTAGAVTQFGAVAAGQTGCPLFIRGTLAADDNKALTIQGNGFAATQTCRVFGYYWYET